MKRFLKQFMEKKTVTYLFPGKAICRGLRCHFLVDTALQIIYQVFIKYLLPEATGSIDEKVTEETTDQNFSNAKFLTTYAAHISMTPPFCYCLAFWDVF